MQNDLISRSAMKETMFQNEPVERFHPQENKMWQECFDFIENAPAVDAVSRSVFEQIKWERDCAMQQLKDHGIPFGGIAPAVNTREKLIELMTDLYGGDPLHYGVKAHHIADHLISNGVTFARDIDVPSKWISVEDGMPEPMVWVLCACRANIIEVLRYDRNIDGWGTAGPNRGYMKSFVTHWMTLPESPGGDAE